MSRLLHCGMFGALCALAAAGASAQNRAARIATAPPASAPRVVAPVRVAPHPPVQVVYASAPASRISGTSNGGVTFVRPQQPIQQFDTTNGYPVPGLGFDYSDLAAFERGERVTHFRDFDRGHNRPEFFTPILFGGYPYYWDTLDMPSDYAQQPAPQQPQVIIVQQPAPVVIVQAPGATTQAAPAATADSDAPAAAPANTAAPADPDQDSIVLIRRDGKLFFASVYTVVGNELRYVTPEGIRHTLKVSDLDVDATRGMNEARGSTFQLPN